MKKNIIFHRYFWSCYSPLTGLTSGAGVLPEDSVNAAVGGSVTFTTSLTPTQTPLYFISWNKGTTNILTSVAGGILINPEYKGRVTLNVLTGSLELRKARQVLRARDGSYGSNMSKMYFGAKP
uniref:Uncharacterized protein n=1 Tax=Neogobius melanostomus TaxID=47308 RepID=A0A8C6SN77_9GOBI